MVTGKALATYSLARAWIRVESVLIGIGITLVLPRQHINFETELARVQDIGGQVFVH